MNDVRTSCILSILLKIVRFLMQEATYLPCRRDVARPHPSPNHFRRTWSGDKRCLKLSRTSGKSLWLPSKNGTKGLLLRNFGGRPLWMRTQRLAASVTSKIRIFLNHFFSVSWDQPSIPYDSMGWNLSRQSHWMRWDRVSWNGMGWDGIGKTHATLALMVWHDSG